MLASTVLFSGMIGCAPQGTEVVSCERMTHTPTWGPRGISTANWNFSVATDAAEITPKDRSGKKFVLAGPSNFNIKVKEHRGDEDIYFRAYKNAEISMRKGEIFCQQL